MIIYNKDEWGVIQGVSRIRADATVIFDLPFLCLTPD